MYIHKLFSQQNNHTGTDIPERTLSKGNDHVLYLRTELYGFTTHKYIHCTSSASVV